MGNPEILEDFLLKRPLRPPRRDHHLLPADQGPSAESSAMPPPEQLRFPLSILAPAGPGAGCCYPLAK